MAGLRNIENAFAHYIGTKAKIYILRKRGTIVGKEVNYLTRNMPKKREAKLLKIGSFTTISNNVSMVFHDGSIGPLINRNPAFKKKGVFVTKFGKIKIGKHVFIGQGTTIIAPAQIGDYCVVGSGSIVTKDIPSGQVWAGIPARFLMDTEVFVEKVLHKNGYNKNLKEIIVKAIYDSSR